MNKFVESVKKLLNSRSLKYGSNSVILVAAVVAIAVFINVLVSPAFLDKLTGKSSFKIDLTPNKLYSIGDTTKTILKGLDKDVEIFGLFDDARVKNDNSLKELTELLEKYSAYPRVKVDYVDIDKKPGFLKDIDADNVIKPEKGDFVFRSGSKIRKVSYYDLYETTFDQYSMQQYKTGTKAEQSFTGAIKYVTADMTPVVYFTEGHDEKSVDKDFTITKEFIERNNYDVKNLNLLTVDKVPEDASVLIVASPQKDLTVDERDRIKEYLRNGGNAIFMFDSLSTDVNFAGFEDVLSNFNVSINYDIVKENDKTRHFPNSQSDLLVLLESNNINTALNPAQFQMIMSKARSVKILKNDKEYISVTPLARTTSKAVGELIDKNRGQDIEGPLNLAVAVENKGWSKPSKVIVMGNSFFLQDNLLQQGLGSGLYFFLNSLSWMQDKKDDVIIAPKNYTPQRLDINAMQANVTSILVVIVLPLLILGAGTFVWIRRRHL